MVSGIEVHLPDQQMSVARKLHISFISLLYILAMLICWPAKQGCCKLTQPKET